jgi:hypothetical protein
MEGLIAALALILAFGGQACLTVGIWKLCASGWYDLRNDLALAAMRAYEAAPWFRRLAICLTLAIIDIVILQRIVPGRTEPISLKALCLIFGTCAFTYWFLPWYAKGQGDDLKRRLLAEEAAREV